MLPRESPETSVAILLAGRLITLLVIAKIAAVSAIDGGEDSRPKRGPNSAFGFLSPGCTAATFTDTPEEGPTSTSGAVCAWYGLSPFAVDVRYIE